MIYHGNVESVFRFPFLLLLKRYVYRDSAVFGVEKEIKKLNKDVVRYRDLKPFKRNFIENLFLGIFEPTVLEYPQIRTMEEVDYLTVHKGEVQKLMLHDIKSKEIESAGKISESVMRLLQEKDVIGMKLKTNKEGLGYYEFESSFIFESLGLEPSVYKTISESENCGFQIINLFGNELQKLEYIPKFLNGTCIPCLAHLENSSWVFLQETTQETVAVKMPDGNYAISGSKTLVYNANISDVIIVSAVVKDVNKDISGNLYTLFLVNKTTKGVIVGQPMKTIGVRGIQICDVSFENVIVPEYSIIGKLNEGNHIINKILSLGKLNNGAPCIGIMKKIIDEAIDYNIRNTYFQQPLYNEDHIQIKTGDIVCTLYAAESMNYLMTGRADCFLDSDVFLESLIVKIFTSEALNEVLYNYVQLTGIKNNSNNDLIERIFRDCYYFNAFEEPNSFLKAFLGFTGIKYLLQQHEKKTIKEYRKKNFFALKEWEIFPEAHPQGKLTGYLHLMLEDESHILEACVEYLHNAAEFLAHKHQRDVFKRSWELTKLSEILIIIYQLTGILGRASRSLCIGLAHADTEISIARSAALNSVTRTQLICQQIIDVTKNRTKCPNFDCELDFRKYSPTHPIAPRSDIK